MKTLREREIKTGDIIEFQVANTSSADCITLKLLHKTGCIELSFDDIKQFFIKKGCSNIFCSTIKVDNRVFQMCNLTLEQFMGLVGGKKFRVYVDNDMYSLKTVSSSCTLELFKEMVLNLSQSGDVTDSPEIARTTCFQFEEALNFR